MSSVTRGWALLGERLGLNSIDLAAPSASRFANRYCSAIPRLRAVRTLHKRQSYHRALDVELGQEVLGARLDALSLFSTGRVYLIGQFGWQGTGLGVYADSGLGLAFQTAEGLEAGVELLTRYARSSGGGGDIHFFRISRALGGRDGDSGGEGSR